MEKKTIWQKAKDKLPLFLLIVAIIAFLGYAFG